MCRIYTIGYEGASVSDFIYTLNKAGVSMLLDIREIPISRRKGFSKKILAQALNGAGIEYRHERALGSPKAIRDALHYDKNYTRFFDEFDKHMWSQREFVKDIATLLPKNVALMCYERDPKTCHRLIVAKHLHELTGRAIFHLGVIKNENDDQTTLYPSQSLSAAQPAI